MPNTLNLKDDYQNNDYYSIEIGAKSCLNTDLLADKLLKTKIGKKIDGLNQDSKQVESKNCFIETKSPIRNFTYDNDYDSTGQKQTDESSSPDDEDLEQFKKDIKVTIHRLKSGPVDFVKRTNSLRGILKYPPGWPKRALSESDASMTMTTIFRHQNSNQSSDDYGYFGTSVESPDISSDCFEYDNMIDDDFDDPNKPKKCVTFSDKMATYVFRPGSSILGRRQKNQKKAKKKKEREMKKCSCLPSVSVDLDNSSQNTVVSDSLSTTNNISDNEIEEIKNAINLKRFGGNINNTIFLVDDGYSCSSSTDVSDISGCSDTSASECSSADESSGNTIEEMKNSYEEESIVIKKENGEPCNSKSKRKNRRRRNRKNKLTIKTYLETGGYDSD